MRVGTCLLLLGSYCSGYDAGKGWLQAGWLCGLAVTAPYALMCRVSPQLRWPRSLTVIAVGMLVCKDGPPEQEPPERVTSVEWGCLLGVWWGGSHFRGSSLEWIGLARLVLRARSEHMVLCRLMEKHRNVALQCWVNWVEGEFFVFVSLKIPYISSIAGESYTKSLPFDIHLKISQKSPLLTHILFKVLPLCLSSE